MQGRHIYRDRVVLEFCLSDHIPKHNLYYRLKQLLELDYLFESTKIYYGSCGQKSIDATVFFKLCLIAHLENIDSDRKLLEMCSLRLDLLYFLGYNLGEELPCHSTLCRTRMLLPRQVFERIFNHILSLCVGAGMVSGATVAVDSAFVKANASMDSLELKVSKEELQQELKKARPVMVTARRKAKKNKASKEQQTVTASKQELQQIESRQQHWHSRQLTTPGGSLKQARFTSNKTHYSPVDPDARIAVKPGKRRQLCYFNQLAVDTAHHVIVHAQADLSDQKDSQCLPRVVEETTQRLLSFDLGLKSVLADGAYCSGENYVLLEKLNIQAYIPVHGTYKGGPDGFIYDQEQDVWICPQGKKATFRKVKFSAQDSLQRQYFTTRSDCKGCPLKESCLGEKQKEKKIDITYYRAEYERAKERLSTRHAEWMKKKRQSTVEPVFGILINYMGLSKINTRGIMAADKKMLLAAAAYNLKKWLNFCSNKRKTAALVAPKATVAALFWLMLIGLWTGNKIRSG
ncbi:transposase, family 11 [Flammeovirgaceae bacterium 311]|nr:transposase, family 11 [Flammeovirgaceae bacterium 311]AHM63386.1 transposase, family 11 [Flammeovirgaceae bacterium 311]